jgi:cytoskeletal protein CcmA (bactofilin family)
VYTLPTQVPYVKLSEIDAPEVEPLPPPKPDARPPQTQEQLHWMLGQPPSKVKQSGVKGYVGQGVQLQGFIVFDGTVRIDGSLEGEVWTNGVLIIGQGAKVNAKVHARSVLCQGKASGNFVIKDNVQLLKPAQFDGFIQSRTLLIEEGVTFNGKSVMNTSEEESGLQKAESA